MAQRPNGQNTIYFPTSISGGATGSLDSLDIVAGDSPNAYDLITGDLAVIGNQTDGFHFYVFDKTSTAAESAPTHIRPDDYDTNGPGVWIEDTSIGYGSIQDGITFNNGAIMAMGTTTAGHEYKFQVHDANGAVWRDAMALINGDSSDANPANWPRIVLGGNVALTGLGHMAAGLIWGNGGVPLTSNQDLEAAGMNQIYKVGANMQVNLPAAADCYASGSHASWVQYIILGAYTVSFNPDGTERIRVMSSTTGLLAAGNELDVTGPGIVTAYVSDDVEDGSSTPGWFFWANVPLADGGSS
jgi:hypothetical protein